MGFVGLLITDAINYAANSFPRAGATVHLVCRNQTRGEEAKQEITSESGSDVRVVSRKSFVVQLVLL